MMTIMQENKQVATEWDAVHICILFCTKRTPGQKDPCCANVCAFLSMLMRVKSQMSNKAGRVSQNGMKNNRLFLKLAFKTCLFVRAKQ